MQKDEKSRLESHDSGSGTKKDRGIEDAAHRANTLPEGLAAIAEQVEGQDRKRVEAISRQTKQLLILEKLNREVQELSERSDAIAYLVEHLAEAADVATASYWKCSEKEHQLHCLDYFDRRIGEHSNSTYLRDSQNPNYFAALLTEDAIAAEDAVNDPRTSELASHYLRPRGITSLLDVPIRVNGEVIAVVCHEHVGLPLRRWTRDDENYAFMLGHIVAMAVTE